MATQRDSDGPSESKKLKKCRVDAETSSKTMSVLPETIVLDLLSALGRICLADINVLKLVPVKIVNSNAAHSNGGVSFSKAFCELKFGDKRYSFGDIFRHGIDLCLEFIEGHLPTNKKDFIVLEKIANFLLSECKIGVDLETLNEIELTKLLTNHLFGKLSTSPCYIIDKNCKSEKTKGWCSCGEEGCKLTGQFGDTSIGNSEVWHGSVDIIIKNDLIIEVLCDEDEPNTPGGRSVVEVKQTSAVLSKNPQIVAETIVFSFLQKQRHPERENFLTPCIGVDSTSLLVMFYDAENDVFLESMKVPLLAQDGSLKFNIEAVLVAWLTVNYNFLCSGITDSMKSFKADFFSQAKDKFEIYQSKLKFTNVGVSTGESVQLKEDFVSSQFLLERQKRINAIQEKRFASKVESEKS